MGPELSGPATSPTSPRGRHGAGGGATGRGQRSPDRFHRPRPTRWFCTTTAGRVRGVDRSARNGHRHRGTTDLHRTHCGRNSIRVIPTIFVARHWPAAVNRWTMPGSWQAAATPDARNDSCWPTWWRQRGHRRRDRAGRQGIVASQNGRGIVVPGRAGEPACSLDAVAAGEASPTVHVTVRGWHGGAGVADTWLDGSVPTRPRRPGRCRPSDLDNWSRWPTWRRRACFGSPSRRHRGRRQCSAGLDERSRPLPGAVSEIAGGSGVDIPPPMSRPEPTRSRSTPTSRLSPPCSLRPVRASEPGDFADPRVGHPSDHSLACLCRNSARGRQLALVSSGADATVTVTTVGNGHGQGCSRFARRHLVLVDLTGAQSVWVATGEGRDSGEGVHGAVLRHRRHRPDPPAGCHTAARCPPRGLDDLRLTRFLTGAVRRSEADLVGGTPRTSATCSATTSRIRGGDLGLAASACLDGTTVDHDPSPGTSPDEPTQAGGPDLHAADPGTSPTANEMSPCRLPTRGGHALAAASTRVVEGSRRVVTVGTGGHAGGTQAASA